MITTTRILAGLVAGAALLAGCTGEIMQSRIERPSALNYFQYAAAPGETRAVVVGNPFPVAKQVVDRAVVDAMQRNHNGPMTHFTTQPGPDAHPNYRIVMAFNTPVGFHPYALCRNPDAISSRPGGGARVQVLAGFCVADKLYSQAKVSAPAMASPGDPRFAQMIRSAMWELVPREDPFDKDEICTFPPC